jgi:ABC-type transporter Mla maintaining outer membrane lipid asymmetry permease subunit MlaE
LGTPQTRKIFEYMKLLEKFRNKFFKESETLGITVVTKSYFWSGFLFAVFLSEIVHQLTRGNNLLFLITSLSVFIMSYVIALQAYDLYRVKLFAKINKELGKVGLKLPEDL